MKPRLHLLSMAILFVIAAGPGYAQAPSGRDSTGLPGDHFSLQGALEMFKTAVSPEEFEKLINTQDKSVNNLDLNDDGEVDYIRVIDRATGDTHSFVLQVPVSKSESQDIAVIELEKTGNDSVMLQIIGDKDIYGEEVIVEPDGGGADPEDDDDQGDGKGPFYRMAGSANPFMPRMVVNVWTWPGVRYVYSLAYVVWASPWRWRAYPHWWHPWRPLAWGIFHPFRVRYRTGFAVVHTHRVVRAHRVYMPGRTTSVVVRTRYMGPVKHYRLSSATIKVRPGGVKARTRVHRGRR